MTAQGAVMMVLIILKANTPSNRRIQLNEINVSGAVLKYLFLRYIIPLISHCYLLAVS